MYGRYYNYPAGQYPYHPCYWPPPHTTPNRPFPFPVLPSNRINFINGSQNPSISVNYSLPSFPIPKPSGSNPTDSKSYCSNFSLSEPPPTVPTHSTSLPHNLSDDELYFHSLWFPESTGQLSASSNIKFRASLHLSLEHIPLKSSFLSHRFYPGESIQTAELSGIMSQTRGNSTLFHPSDSRTNCDNSVTEHSQDNQLPQKEKSPLLTNDFSQEHSNSFLTLNEPIGSDISLQDHQYPTQNNNSRNSPSAENVSSVSIDSPYTNSAYPSPISSPKQLSHQQSPLSQLKNLKSPDAIKLSPQHSPIKYYPKIPHPIQRTSSCSPPSPVTPNSSPSPQPRSLLRKRSLPFSDSDSSEGLPDVTFVAESPDECCFVVSTTTPRMARELKLSPTNVSLTGIGLDVPSDLYTFPPLIKHEQSSNSLLCEIPDNLLSADLIEKIEGQSPTIQHTSGRTEENERDVPPSEMNTGLAPVQTSAKQVLNRKLRKTPHLSVTKAKTTPLLNFPFNQTLPPAPDPPSSRKNSTSRAGTNQYGDTPLHRLSQAGHLGAVERAVLEQQIPVNAQDNAGWTALHEACSSGHKQVAVFLLQQGANPNIVSNDGTAPIHDAVTSGDINFLKLMVSYGADPLVNKGDTSPLDMDTSDQIRAYLREIAIQRGHYHPGLPTFPDTPISPTSFIKPARFSNSLQTLRPDPQLFKQSIPTEIESDLYYITPMFETRQKPFLPTFSLPVSLNSGYQFMGNFYFLPDVLNQLGINFKEFSLVLPDISIFKFSRYEFFDHIPATDDHLLHCFPETEKLEFVADTILLQHLLGIQIQNMEI